MTKHRRRLGPDQVGQHPVLPGLRQARQPLGQPGVRAGDAGLAARRCRTGQGPPGFGQAGQKRAGPLQGEGRGEPRPVHIRDRHQPLAVVEHLAQRAHRQAGVHYLQPAPLQLGPGLCGAHAATAPQTPGHRGRREPTRPAPFGQPVQERVRRRVSRLQPAAPRRRGRGEQHERVQVQACGQLIQVRRTRRLGRQHPGQLRHGHVRHRGALPGARGMQHRGQRRPARADPGQQPGHRIPLGGIARQYAHRGPAGGQPGGQGGRPGPVRAGPAGQDHPGHTTPGQPPGHVPADPAGPAGHQHRSP